MIFTYEAIRDLLGITFFIVVAQLVCVAFGGPQ